MCSSYTACLSYLHLGNISVCLVLRVRKSWGLGEGKVMTASQSPYWTQPRQLEGLWLPLVASRHHRIYGPHMVKMICHPQDLIKTEVPG
jgi:hypothetical protein